MPFYSTGHHYCPTCPIATNSKGRKFDDTMLRLIESNYSGCGVDIAECPKCQRLFQISYKVDTIVEFGPRRI